MSTHMPAAAQDGWLTRDRVQALVLAAATLIGIWICWLLARPFLPALCWATALAVVAHPLHAWLSKRISHPNVAAGLGVAIVAVAILLPVGFVIERLVSQAAANAQRVQEEAASGRWQQIIEANPRLAPTLNWLRQNIDLNKGVQQLATGLVGNAAAVVGGSLWTLAQLLLTLFALFYFFRDRRAVLRAVRSYAPLDQSETDWLFHRIGDTIHASIYGTLAVAMVQGTLGGLIFWWLRLPAPLVWGVVMALLAIVPYLGAFVVWLPAAAFLALEGSWGKAIALTAWGTIVVGLIDNLLYPILVGNRLRLHTVAAFVAVVGGLMMFGAAGLVLGPLALAVTLALVEVWRRRTEYGQAADA